MENAAEMLERVRGILTEINKVRIQNLCTALENKDFYLEDINPELVEKLFELINNGGC